MRRAAAALVVLALAGCASLGAKDTQRYFVLDAAAAKAAPAAAPGSPATLLIAPTSASTFYDTQEIVFSRVAGQRAYYLFSYWTEPPARTLDRLIAARLEASGAFATVAQVTSGLRGGLVLRANIVEMFHDATSDPGQVRLVLEAELGDPVKRTLLARQSFVATVPVASADAAGAVQAFGIAVGSVLDELVAWTRGHAPAAP
jgi:cholesterol transport system auxiliary component